MGGFPDIVMMEVTKNEGLVVALVIANRTEVVVVVVFQCLCCAGFRCVRIRAPMIGNTLCCVPGTSLFPSLVDSAAICRAERCSDAPGSTPYAESFGLNVSRLIVCFASCCCHSRSGSSRFALAKCPCRIQMFHYSHALTLCLAVHMRPARSRTLKWSGGFARRSKLGEGRFSSWTRRHCAPPEGTQGLNMLLCIFIGFHSCKVFIVVPGRALPDTLVLPILLLVGECFVETGETANQIAPREMHLQ